LAGLSFMEILQDICPEGLPRARSLVGDGASASGPTPAASAGGVPDFASSPPSEPAPPAAQSAPADDFF